MDRTLKRAKRNNKRRGQRNHGAWQRFSPDGKTCRYCPHDGSQHLCQSGQPHFFRPARRWSGETPRSCSTATRCPWAARSWCGG